MTLSSLTEPSGKPLETLKKWWTDGEDMKKIGEEVMN